MSYQTKASRKKPCPIFFVLDDSESMSWELAGSKDSRLSWVELYFGVILYELLKRSTEMAGDSERIKPRYFIYVLTYGNTTKVWGDGLMDIGKAVQTYANAKESIGLGGILGGTDAGQAFEAIESHIRDAVADARFADSFPPLVFHITDGESATDATPIVDRIRGLTTTDGNVLVLNAYIGTQTSLAYNGPDDFPGYLSAQDVGSDPDNLRLFSMSSDVPESIHESLVKEAVFPKLRTGSRLFFDVRTKEMLRNVIQVVGSIASRDAH